MQSIRDVLEEALGLASRLPGQTCHEAPRRPEGGAFSLSGLLCPDCSLPNQGTRQRAGEASHCRQCSQWGAPPVLPKATPGR